MLLLHIGPHKTATTYIQQNLFANRDALAARGWLYPEFGTAGLAGHHHIAHNGADYLSGQHTEALAALGKQAKEASQNIVLSAEGFCRWSPTKFQALLDLLGQDQLHLVYVIRDPFDLLYSYWAEEVKQGYCASFADRFIENIAQGARSRLLNPMRDLSSHLETKSVKVSAIPYDVLKAEGIDIFDHFSKAVMDLQDLTKADEDPKNVAFPIELTEVLRMITTMRSNGKAHIGSELRGKFLTAVKPVDRRNLVDLLRKHGAPARRSFGIEGLNFVKRRLELITIKGLVDRWTYPVEGKSIYRNAPQSYIYFDSFALWQIEAIRVEVQDLLERL